MLSLLAFVWILSLKGHHSLDLKEAPEHVLKRCVQDEFRNIDCHEIKTERRDMISQWPPGPYVIPMSRYGCPESSMHGWREGYIVLIWQNPQTVHVQTDVISNTADDGTDAFASLSFGPVLPTSYKHLLHIPTTQTYLKVNFCFKYRRNVSVDIGSWPEDNYSVFGTENDCPNEFSTTYSNFSIPNITDWDSDGYLPDFKIYKEGVTDYLQIKLCCRQKGSVNSSSDDNTSLKENEHSRNISESYIYRNWTSFFLVKNRNTSCPTFRQTVMFEERTYTESHDGDGTTVHRVFPSLCFYELGHDEQSWLFERRRKHAYSVNIADISQGNFTDVRKRRVFSGLFFRVIQIYIVHFWKVFDLGKTIPISAVEITLYRALDEPMDQICTIRLFGCFVSREKWSFLYSEAFSCLYIPYCRVTGQSTTLVFKRRMEGRYLTLVRKEEFSIVEDSMAPYAYYVEIFMETNFGHSPHCDVDLGMKNLNIDDEQISASSFLEGFSPAQARPYNTGWCPAFDDRDAYIKVDFPSTTTIEGLTVYSSRDSIIRNRASAYTPLLTLTYSDNSNVTNPFKVLKSDATKMREGSLTFLFLIPIHVKNVSLIVNSEEMLSSSSCLRFEFHGCTPNGNGSISVLNRGKQVPPFELLGYISELFEPGSILTSIGYPTRYQSMESYKWIIRFPESNFIRLVFTEIDFSFQRERSTNRDFFCNDSLVISNDLVNVDPSTSRVIDNRLAITHYSISVETKETQLVLTFLSCLVSSLINRGNGFKAYAMFQDIPTCFSIDGGQTDWQEGSREICRRPSMFIKSMSYLGFPFVNTMETWTIYVPMRRIHLQILDFNVPCFTYLTNPPFKIIDMAEERSYCNIYRPPNSYNSTTDNVTVVFFKGVDNVDKSIVTFIEGFKMLYTITEEEEERLISANANLPETKNVALHKPTVFCEWMWDRFDPVDVYVNGLTTFETQTSTSSRPFKNTNLYFYNTVLIDLQDLYTLDYIVLYGAPILDTSCVNTLLTGVAITGLRPTYYFCGSFVGGRAIKQKGIKTRFVRLDLLCENSLSEIEVYGKLEAFLGERPETKFQGKYHPLVVFGEWSLWTSWTDVCFCDGKQYRQRFCNDPKPDLNVLECPGENLSSRQCDVANITCSYFNASADNMKKVCTEDNEGNNGLSTWSDWSPCSSFCGHGLMTRSKTCLFSGLREDKGNCLGNLSEEKPCFSNENCRICPNASLKCYNIITKYTNWEQARLECMIRNMTLVSILSLPEMRLLKYLLRRRRQSDGLPIDYFDADFYVHIGINLKRDSVPVWENGLSALYFNAWKERKPSVGKCARMNFRSFDDDNTWESEDCKHQLAEYTVCEYHRHNLLVPVVKSLRLRTDYELDDIPEQIPVSQYDGNANVAITGSECNMTFCRDTLNRGYPSCDTTEGYTECSVKLPYKKNSTLTFPRYIGKLNKTFSGKICQRWDTQIPNNHQVHGFLFLGEGISDANNYCRDIENSGTKWCYTTDGTTRWEPCLIEEIKTERLCIEQIKYTGTRNKTITGKTCMSWDKHHFQKESIYNVDLTENYCRDPFGYGFDWCYVYSLYGIKSWEPCLYEDNIFDTHETIFETPNDERFECHNGNEDIPEFLRCNGKFDCSDKSDETECLSMFKIHKMTRRNIPIYHIPNNKEGLFYRCLSGERISIIAKCDGVIDCLDASDETECEFNSSGIQELCRKDQFRCDDGECVHVSLLCNHEADCLDASDEYCEFEDCLTLNEYRCLSGECIPLRQRCDAVKQCPDGSDEKECDVCQSNAFHCDIAACIPTRLRCDGLIHCEDETDETACDPGYFLSCTDVWRAGYRKTGWYKIDDVLAICQFDDVHEKKKVSTVRHLDLIYKAWSIGDLLRLSQLYFYNILSTKLESKANSLLIYRDDNYCTQQIWNMCLPTYEIAVQLNFTNECGCSVDILELDRDSYYVIPTQRQACPAYTTNLTVSETSFPPVTYRYMQNLGFRFLIIPKRDIFHQILSGPLVCEKDITTGDDNFPCNINGKTIPSQQRCVYDIDVSGFPDGCTDGSHLLFCESYDCPQNTLKCPGSFCLPHRFICDGEVQCPGGEDEEDCGCLESTNEILIIYDKDSLNGPNTAAFAYQFYSQRNIVRLLSYTASKPLQKFGIDDIMLDVQDTEIHKSLNTGETFSCHYNIFAKQLLDSAHFTNDGTKGVIIIQNSEISKEVFNLILENNAVSRRNLIIYRISLNSDKSLVNDKETFSASFKDLRVRRWKQLDGIGAEYFSELCKISTKIHCLHGYKCSASKLCIPMNQVCDGQKQCLHGDDEVLCPFQCPVDCSCAGYFTNCSATSFNIPLIETIPKTTRYLDISLNRNMSSVLKDVYLIFSKLSVLNVSGCNVEIIHKTAFFSLRNLQSLDLSYNKIKILPNFVFSHLWHLRNLLLQGNFELSIIEPHAFSGLSLIQDLDLSGAKLSKVSSDTFEGMNLKSVNLASNKLQEIEKYAFRNSYVESINFENNDIKYFHEEIFTGLVGLNTLRTPAFKFCCIRPNYVLEQNCYPHQDEFSSCDDLMRHSGLQFMIWLIGIMALLGNILSIVYRMKYDKERLKLGYGIFVTNLAVADFLMAIYLLIIAIADSAFRKRYIYAEDYWRHSFWCTLAGVLSTTSSEASVLFLCLITLDRLIVIKFPFGGVKITTKKATTLAVCAWVFSLLAALFPVAYTDYFKNEFYSKSGVCIALPLTRDRPPGWAYSLAIFICLNFVTFILVAFGQLSIFIEIRKSTGIATSAASTRRRDLKVARNLLLVVASDFLCWFPIGVMGMLALTDHPVSGEVYAWAAVFILPVNSALNPLLYTLSAIIGAKSFNPNIDEQSYLRLTKDIGMNTIKCMLAGSQIFPSTITSTFIDMKSLSMAKLEISSRALVKIATKLSFSLDALHGCSLGIHQFEENSILVGIRNEKVTGNIKVKGEPYISYKSEDKQNDVYQLGMILKSLISAKLKSKDK